MAASPKGPSAFGSTSSFTSFLMRTEPQKLLEEDFNTGKTCRMIGGEIREGISLGKVCLLGGIAKPEHSMGSSSLSSVYMAGSRARGKRY